MSTEIQFINVRKPSQQVSQDDLSRIKAHAMRQTHRRRRLGQVRAFQAQRPPEIQSQEMDALSPIAESTDNVHVVLGWVREPDRSPQTHSRQRVKPTSSVRSKTDVIVNDTPSRLQLTTSDKGHATVEYSQCVQSKLPRPNKTEGAIYFPNETPICSNAGKLLAICSADMVFGGFGKDPFQMYPIKAQEYFPAAMKFLQEEVAAGPSFVRFVMSHDVLFEAIMTYALCVMPKKTRQTETAMMYHYGGTLSKIKAQLLLTGECGDAVLGAIGNLAVICAYYGDTSCFELHCQAIHRLVQMRGGKLVLENDNSWMKALLPSLDALAANRQGTRAVHELANKDLLYLSLGSVESTNVPIYPSHPVPSELSTLISTLPEGFRHLASDGSLSLQVIRRLSLTRSEIVRLMATAQSDRDHWHQLLRRLTTLERLVWFAILVVYLRGSTYIADCGALAEAVLECLQRRTPASSASQKECVLWGACLIIAAPDPERKLEQQRESIIAAISNKPKMTLVQIHGIVKNYLWIDSLSENLDDALGPYLTSGS